MRKAAVLRIGTILAAVTLCSCVRGGFDEGPGHALLTDSAPEIQADLPRPDGPASDGPASDGPASDGPLATDAPACVQRSQILSITNNADDGEIDWPMLFDSGETHHRDPADWLLFMGYWQTGGASYSWGYFRFTLADPIPAGAKIESAALGLWGAPTDQAGAWDESRHALRIFFEASGSAAAVTMPEEAPDQAAGRPLLGTSERWPNSSGLSWKLNDYNESPDLGPMLEELIGEVGPLPAGARLQIWIRGDFVGEDAEVATCDVGQLGCYPTSLTIKWCE